MIIRNISLSKSLIVALLSSALFIACSGDTNQMEEPVAAEGEAGGDGAYAEMESEQDYLDSPELEQGNELFEGVEPAEMSQESGLMPSEDDEIDQPAAEEFAEAAISQTMDESEDAELTSSEAEMSAANFENDESIDHRPVEDVTLHSDTEPTFLESTNESGAEPDFGFESTEAVATNMDESYQYQEPAVSKPAPVVSQNDSFDSYASTASSSAAGNASYIVQPGDTLSQISQMIYGTSHAWKRLAQENGIQEPFKIHPGDELRYDSSDQAASTFASNYNAGKFSTLTVEHGDTLSKIAKRIFGSAAGWRTLFAYNASKIRNPDLIYVGMQLSYRDPQQTALNASSSNNESH